MTPDSRGWDKKSKLIWMLILIAACGVYFTGISHESIWYDEAFSMKMTEHSPLEIIAFTMEDNHPPLYYLLLKITRELLGTSEAALRALSALAAVLIIALGAGPIRRIFGNRTAYIYAAVTLFTPVVLIYAHEARMYTLSMLSVTAGLLYALLAMRDDRRRDWIYFALSTLAAAYLHYYALIAAFFIHLFVLIRVLTKQPGQRNAALLASGAVLICYLPWLLPFIHQIRDVKSGFWLGATTVENVVHAFYQPFVYKDYFHWSNAGIESTMHIALLGSVLLIVVGGVVAIKKKVQPVLTAGGLLLFVYFGTLAMAIIVSLTLTPIFYARYFLVCAVLFSLLLSMGISVLPGKIAPPAVIGIFALLNIFVMKDVYTDYFNHPMKQLAGAFKERIKPGDLIATSDSYSLGPALYYFPEAVHYHSSNVWESRWGHVLEALRPFFHEAPDWKKLFNDRRTFWYITSNSGGSKRVDEILQYRRNWEVIREPEVISEPTGHINFTVTQYAITEKTELSPHGAITVHLTGVRPVGNMMITLHDGPFGDFKNPLRSDVKGVSEEEFTYTFSNVTYGEYSVIFAHDENNNNVFDMDDDNELPVEGIWFSNPKNMTPEQLKKKENVTFDNMKFPLQKPKRTLEGKMFYPPQKDD